MKKLLRVLPLGLLLLAACGGGELEAPREAQKAVYQASRTRGLVISQLQFGRQTPDGKRPGFDLDGRVSTKADDLGCNKDDFESPTGEKGIDNALAGVIPDVEAVFKNAVDGLIQGSINDGQLLLYLEMQNVDDDRNDAQTDVQVELVAGRPTLGTDGWIEGYQTYDVRSDAEVSKSATGKIQNGVFTAGPMDVAILIKIFDVSFTLHVHKALFRGTIDEEGNVVGMMGGGIDVKELIDGVSKGAGVAQVIGPVTLALNTAADLAPDKDEVCRQLSATLEFKAVPAFIRR